MKVLQLNRDLLELYIIRYGSDGTPWHIILIRQFKVAFMIISLFFGWVASVVFIIIHVKTELQRSLYAVFQIAAEFSANYTVCIACLYPELIEGIFIKVNDIRENVIDYTKSYSGCFGPVDRLCHKLTQLMVYGVLISYIIISIVQGVLNGAYCYLRDDGINPQCLYSPYKFSSPWNQNTLIGRCGTIIFCAIQASIYGYVTTSFLSFFITIGLQFDAFRIYMKGFIDELDDITNQQAPNEKEIQNILCDIVRFHVAVKEIKNSTAATHLVSIHPSIFCFRLYSFYNFGSIFIIYSSLFWLAADFFNRYTSIQVLGAVVFMSSNLLNIDLAIQNPGADVGIICYVTIITLINLYLYCYFGEYTSNSFKNYPQYLFESQWYKLPVKFQKYFILIIGSSQRPLNYDGFRMVSLNLETFLKVLKTAGSYYLVMKAAIFK